MRLSIGLPVHDTSDRLIRDAIALYCSEITVTKRTLLAHVASPHDLAMLIDSLQSERLLGAIRWINHNAEETHP